MKHPDKAYWDERWSKLQLGWDIGFVSTPIKTYVDQLKNKELRILIPGAGNGWEAEYLYEQGFKNVHVLDISELALAEFQKRIPEFPMENMHVGDFFEHQNKYDLIIEQTFLSALHPSMRERYAEKMANLLKSGGKLMGLIFNVPCFDDHPPYGGHHTEYRPIFEPFFDIQIMEEANNSIKPRMGSELFILLRKK